MSEEVKDCFSQALKDKNKRKKHKGLLIIKPEPKLAEEYILKAKKNIELCYLLKESGFDYKIPEEWFYTLYYCALSILAKLGVESRSQRCTAAFIRYAKEKGLVEFDQEFIDRITVYKEVDSVSDVDEREKARYGASIYNTQTSSRFNQMIGLCRKAIDQAENVVHSDIDISMLEPFY